MGITRIEKLAKNGYKPAQFVIGQAYADDGRYDIAFRYYSRAGRGNHYEAAYEAACLSEKGAKGVKKNDREALEYYTKAALGGHRKAIYRLAMAELYGQLGLRRNIHNGMKWLNQGETGINILFFNFSSCR